MPIQALRHVHSVPCVPARFDLKKIVINDDAGEASRGERAWAEVRVAREPEGCGRRGGGRRARVAERETEGVVGGGAEPRRVVPDAESEAVRAGSVAILLRRRTYVGRAVKRRPEFCGWAIECLCVLVIFLFFFP